MSESSSYVPSLSDCWASLSIGTVIAYKLIVAYKMLELFQY